MKPKKLYALLPYIDLNGVDIVVDGLPDIISNYAVQNFNNTIFFSTCGQNEFNIYSNYVYIVGNYDRTTESVIYSIVVVQDNIESEYMLAKYTKIESTGWAVEFQLENYLTDPVHIDKIDGWTSNFIYRLTDYDCFDTGNQYKLGRFIFFTIPNEKIDLNDGDFVLDIIYNFNDESSGNITRLKNIAFIVSKDYFLNKGNYNIGYFGLLEQIYSDIIIRVSGPYSMMFIPKIVRIYGKPLESSLGSITQYNFQSITHLIANELDVSNITSTVGFFNSLGSPLLTYVDISNWQGINLVEDKDIYFGNSRYIKYIKMRNCYFPEIRTLAYTFQHLNELEIIDLTGMIFDHHINASQMFYGCTALKYILSEKDLSPYLDSNNMFEGGPTNLPNFDNNKLGSEMAITDPETGYLTRNRFVNYENKVVEEIIKKTKKTDKDEIAYSYSPVIKLQVDNELIYNRPFMYYTLIAHNETNSEFIIGNSKNFEFEYPIRKHSTWEKEEITIYTIKEFWIKPVIIEDPFITIEFSYCPNGGSNIELCNKLVRLSNKTILLADLIDLETLSVFPTNNFPGNIYTATPPQPTVLFSADFI